MIAAAKQLPDYVVRVAEDDVTTSGGRGPVEVTISITVSLSQQNSSESGARKPKGFGMTSFLVITSDGQFVDFRRTPLVPPLLQVLSLR